jgi:hypothetical protein
VTRAWTLLALVACVEPSHEGASRPIDDYLGHLGTELVLRARPRLRAGSGTPPTPNDVAAWTAPWMASVACAAGPALPGPIRDRTRGTPVEIAAGTWEIELEWLIPSGPDSRPADPLEVAVPVRTIEGVLGRPCPPGHPWWPAGLGVDQIPYGLERLPFEVEEAPRSRDAFPPYAALFGDDRLLDVDVFLGPQRTDDPSFGDNLATLERWLAGRGYGETEGAFERTMATPFGDVRVEVHVHASIEGAPARPADEELLSSLGTRDAVVFAGHSGSGGRTLFLSPDHVLAAERIAASALPAERAQVVLLDSCSTYAFSDAFASNPAKPAGAFLDLVTTGSFSAVDSVAAVQALVDTLAGIDRAGRHRPRTYGAMLRWLATTHELSLGRRTLYGVHFVDDNPTIDPYAR